MFYLIQTTSESSDCTCEYEVKLDKEYTVGEFVNTVLDKCYKERGYIGIFKDTGHYVDRTFGNPLIQYKYGLLKTDNFSNKILNQKIKSVTASGGWSRIDYLINL